jgi:transcriptional regulator with XRE-family HTH domain
VVLQQLRTRGRWSLRALATRAHTSHATLSAYQSGRVSPSVDTLDRVVRAGGFDLAPRLTRRVEMSDGIVRGEELAAVLRLAAAFPVRPAGPVAAARFGH